MPLRASLLPPPQRMPEMDFGKCTCPHIVAFQCLGLLSWTGYSLTLIFIPMELEYNMEKEAENWDANLS